MAIEGAGAPQGNLNSAKSVLPVLKRLRQGKRLPPELTRIAALADREAEELISDRGCANKKALLVSVTLFRGFV